jgi:hypothetical protein
MHKTEAGEKAKALKAEAEKLAREAKAAMKAAKTFPEAGEKARKLEGQAEKLKAEAETLKEAARLEDLTVWVMEKVKPTKKGPKTYTYWMASWRDGKRTRNVHLGSTGKLDEKTASLKARKVKAEAIHVN